MTIKQLIMRGSIPFEVALPKEEYELCQYFTKEELDKTAEELVYTREHPKEYKSYNNISELKETLLSDEEL